MQVPLLNTATNSWLSPIQGICFDIDDTFSSDGKITPEAFESLWSLKRAGFYCVPVTGRPAGWCDHIARFWPVDAVVGENGAFTMFLKDKKLHRVETLADADALNARAKLSRLRAEILKRFPESKFASDQEYRNYDLAIDICEDVPAWSRERTEELISFCESSGAIAKLSSIHVNTWFGNYTKVEGLKKCISEILPQIAATGGKSPGWNNWVYIGDSPNDEPLFQAFPKSVGVANLKHYADRLKFFPNYITEHEAGLGFQELAKTLTDF